MKKAFFNGDELNFYNHYADAFTQIDYSKRLNDHFRHLNQIDRGSYPRNKLRLRRFIDMSRSVFSEITPTQRDHLIYYCKKLDRQYHKQTPHIFYLALIQLGKFSPFEAYQLYPFNKTLSLTTAFRLAAELNLYRRPNLKYNYLTSILPNFPLPDMEKFILYYESVYDLMLHTRPQNRVKFCLRIFYSEIERFHLTQLFSFNKTILHVAFNAFKRKHPKLAYGLVQTARAIRYE